MQAPKRFFKEQNKTVNLPVLKQLRFITCHSLKILWKREIVAWGSASPFWDYKSVSFKVFLVFICRGVHFAITYPSATQLNRATQE